MLLKADLKLFICYQEGQEIMPEAQSSNEVRTCIKVLSKKQAQGTMEKLSTITLTTDCSVDSKNSQLSALTISHHYTSLRLFFHV